MIGLAWHRRATVVAKTTDDRALDGDAVRDPDANSHGRSCAIGDGDYIGTADPFGLDETDGNAARVAVAARRDARLRPMTSRLGGHTGHADQ